jgi:hypothetical protein
MEKDDKMPQKWINTPFAFTRFSKNMTLLQQRILVKVSERLQPFIEEFFGSELCRSHDKPKELFSQAAKNSGITHFDISYAELGVPANNYFAAQETARKVLELKVSAPVVGKDGKPAMRDYNVFSFSETSAGKDRVIFQLNTELIEHIGKHVVDYVFDMSEKYVSHPDNIAFIGNVDRMPMIYYLLRKSCNNVWKPEIRLTVKEIKEYLGMIEYADGTIVKEAYPKFSQFKKNVLDTSIEDINRLKRDGLLDVFVTYEAVYTGKRKIGTPYFIRFRTYAKSEDYNKATLKSRQQTDIFTINAPGTVEWQKVLQLSPAKVAEGLKAFVFLSYDDKTSEIMLGANNRAQVEEFERLLTKSEKETYMKALYKCFGKAVKLRYRTRKE